MGKENTRRNRTNVAMTDQEEKTIRAVAEKLHISMNELFVRGALEYTNKK